MKSQPAPTSNWARPLKVAVVKLVGAATTIPVANACRPMSLDQAQAIQEQLEPGDILLSSNKDVPAWNALMNALGSRYSHASIYVGHNQVISSGAAGATRSRLFETGSHYALLKPGYPSEADRNKAVDFAQAAESARLPYNWLGDPQEPGLNCTQLVAQSVAAGIPTFEAPTQQLLGQRFIPVDGLLASPQLQALENFPLDPSQNLAGAMPVLGASLVGGAAGGYLAQTITQNVSSGLVGAGLGMGLGYILSSVAVLAHEMKEQPPLYQMPWRSDPQPQVRVS